ncbi:hypothetical protein LI951_05300 [Enterococcus sp. BWT-B8]|uniref:hypothetical protein n=1 Tax=Enterococcus sp. BWT-B8 TaxID=2885157 RepID=UPI001E623FE3|nr:hypothetical protein [Enterococcus sp. BWT-B8]MCB5951474.1 hypothetical protein [Enterococcus sp. BWT-B8]
MEILTNNIQSEVTLVSNADGRLELFAINKDGSMYQAWQTKVNGGTKWESKTIAGPFDGNVFATTNQNGGLVISVLKKNGDLFISEQAAPNFAPWKSITISGPFQKNAMMKQNKDGHLDLFAIKKNGDLFQAWQSSPNGKWIV